MDCTCAKMISQLRARVRGWCSPWKFLGIYLYHITAHAFTKRIRAKNHFAFLNVFIVLLIHHLTILCISSFSAFPCFLLFAEVRLSTKCKSKTLVSTSF